ncbi:MAG: hypothetical protein QXY70_02765 [Nanopusillaceae archaeon]
MEGIRFNKFLIPIVVFNLLFSSFTIAQIENTPSNILRYNLNMPATSTLPVGVTAIYISNDKSFLLIGGNFTHIEHAIQNSISVTSSVAKINIHTGELLPISTSTPSIIANGIITAIYYDEIRNRLYLGGYFTEINSTTARGLAMIDLNNGSIRNYDLGSSGSGNLPYVRIFLPDVDSNLLYMGGFFNQIDGYSLQNFAVIDLNTGNILNDFQLRNFTDSSGIGVQSMLLTNFNNQKFLLVGGSFNMVEIGEGFMYVNNIAIFNITDLNNIQLVYGNQDNAIPLTTVYSIVFDRFRGRYYLGGLQNSDGLLVVLEPREDTTTQINFPTGPYKIYTLAIDELNGVLYIGGQDANNNKAFLGALDISSTTSATPTPLTFNPSINGLSIFDLLFDNANNYLYVGGFYDQINEISTNFTAFGAYYIQPFISSISPTSTSVGSNNVNLSIEGFGFYPTSTVYFNGNPLSKTYNSPTSISAIIPSSYLTSPGTYNILVRNPSPGGGDSNSVQFVVYEVINQETRPRDRIVGGLLPNEASWPPFSFFGGLVSEKDIILNDNNTTTTERIVKFKVIWGPNINKVEVANNENFSNSKIFILDPVVSRRPEYYLWDICEGKEDKECKEGFYSIYFKFYTAWNKSSSPIKKEVFYSPVKTNIEDKKVKEKEVKMKSTIPIPKNFRFKNYLKFGDSGLKVKYLQIILNQDEDTMVAKEGLGSPGKETIYFREKTLDAVKRFQLKYSKEILEPYGLNKPTGFVGPRTIKKLNEILDYLLK